MIDWSFDNTVISRYCYSALQQWCTIIVYRFTIVHLLLLCQLNVKNQMLLSYKISNFDSPIDLVTVANIHHYQYYVRCGIAVKLSKYI